MSSTVALKYVADINRHVIDEDTDPAYRFRYVDIGSVGRGDLVAPLQEIAFEGAPSRARRVVRDGDTLISTVRTYLRAVWHVEQAGQDLVASTGFAVVSPRAGTQARFLSWCLQSDPFIEEVVARSTGVSYPAINPNDLAAIEISLPPLPEQRAIADYLDAETARIDALVTKKRRLIELAESRFTRSCDQWFETVRGTQGLTSLRRIATCIEQGWSPQCEEVEADPAEWGVLKTSAVSTGRFDASKNKRLPQAVEADVRWKVSDGDLLVTRGSGSRSSVARVAVARTEGRLLTISDLIYRVRTSGLADPMYVARAMSCSRSRADLESSIRTDAGQTLKVRVDDLKDLRIPLPPLDEQRRIVAELDAAAARTEALTSKLARQIDLLTEHRQALITAAVTGELEIPTAA